MRLEIERGWDGSAATRGNRAAVAFEATASGLRVEATCDPAAAPRIPDAPVGRLDGLWHFDVVECFLVGRRGDYLEVELGAAGHWLVLAFDRPRHRVDDHAGLAPVTRHARVGSGWRTSILLPTAVVPPELVAVNAFAILGGEHLAHHPLPGPAPDFHQPARYPELPEGSALRTWAAASKSLSASTR